ncbi:anaerobic ribonucleoside-triphosphate reductase [Corynebacterium atypicum]|nr:anaerobic ribonucleoside-triphosphate reductase [Corynebacterium atypicum]
MPDLKIVKKDGQQEAFRPGKILNLLRSAERVFGARPQRDPEEIVAAVTSRVAGAPEQPVRTSEIARIFREELGDSPEVLQAFRRFESRKEELIANSTDVNHAIMRVVNKDQAVMAENGNKDARTFTTQREILAGAVSKAEGLQIYPEEIARAHVKGLIHLHDLDRSPFGALPNCSLPDFGYLLEHGFTLGTAKIESPHSIAVAATVTVQLLGAISGEQYGGISIHEIDRLLEPYAEMTLEKARQLYAEVVEDAEEIERLARKKAAKDIFDAMQAFEYQVNTLTTSAAQTPFTSISFGMGTSWCAREIQKSILAVREAGMSGETAIFPKLLFFADEGVNLAPGDPNYDIKLAAMRCSTKRIYPDLLSVPRIREEKNGLMVTPMGCRSFLHYWEDETGTPRVVGRNNLGVVSLNLPRLAIQAEGDSDVFFDSLDEAIELALRALEVREQVVLGADLENAPVMYTQGGLGDPAGITCVRDWYTGKNEKRASISLGYIGIHNAMVALTGEEHWQKDEELRALGLHIMEHINMRVDAAQGRFHAQLSVYSTPSESLCDRFAALDRDRFGVIEKVNDAEYYENSFHFPSYQDTDPFSKIHFEAPYMHLAPGGFMYYVEAPNLQQNPEAFEAIWDEAFDNVGYFGINSPVDSCFVCGFEGEFNCDELGYVCPGCGNRDETKASVTRRLCGYLGSPMKRPVVKGKQHEINSRVKHM